jgi:uncharacterized protein (DUF488 family)
VTDRSAAVAVSALVDIRMESVWWRCHRRLLADFASVAREVEVGHLMHDGGQATLL